MKVAVSIPDDVFHEAEAMARRLNTSRSRLYARALDDFVVRNALVDLTAAINAVIDEVGDEPDAFVREAGRRIFERLDQDERDVDRAG